jgi:predicted GTPase
MITGPVSAGKSTLTNLLFVEQFSDMKIKRTTAVPQIYHEVGDINQVSDLKSILQKNRATNTDIMKKTENPSYKLKLEDVKEIEYCVPKLFDFLDLRKDVVLTIYDTPGLNDSRTKDVYYQYINNVFNKLNVIIFVLDINSAMNTSDENDILRMIITNIKSNKVKYNVDTKLVVLLNKCDDMSLNNHTNKYG